ncbi:2-nitropropane dioxygenase precursor [Thelonectria olida]|uniref:2-nitropropane dioxygenase n=1 Tax=Thelonectria olida TaxID=1576542 RepID=A0A9P8WDA5_9HYPO|nr:2-nitropropane dioxygenase precursor [Thelonectria olida]
MSTIRAALSKTTLRWADKFPWAKTPFIVGAPMRVMSGPDLALAVSKAGGLGFIGPGAKPEDTARDLAAVRELLSKETASFPPSKSLPVGVGFQLWNGDINSATRAVKEHRPCAVWLFAPRRGQQELDEWTARLREASPESQVWVQIGTLQESIDAAKSEHPPDVLVIQGAEAGGHGRAKDGLGIMALFPEIADKVRNSGIALIAAGGIADGRGVAAALALGASGVALGTRFLAAKEARISKGYQDEVVRASDGAHNTTRTMLYNQLRGTTGWPEEYSPRGIINKSWNEEQAGVPFDELKQRHDQALKAGDKGWGPEGRLATYAGAAIGLVHGVESASVLVKQLHTDTREVLNSLKSRL